MFERFTEATREGLKALEERLDLLESLHVQQNQTQLSSGHKTDYQTKHPKKALSQIQDKENIAANCQV